MNAGSKWYHLKRETASGELAIEPVIETGAAIILGFLKRYVGRWT